MRLGRLSMVLAMALWLASCTYGVNVLDLPNPGNDTGGSTPPDQQDSTASPASAPGGNPQQGCVVFVDSRAARAALDGKSWATAFKTVQEGLLSASNQAPCEVWVAGGTYPAYQSSVADSVVLKEKVSVYGGFTGQETARDQRVLGKSPSILDGQSKVYHVVRGSVQCLMDGFTIQQGLGYCAPGNPCTASDSIGGGLLVEGGFVTVSNCTFSRNAASKGGGIFQSGGSLVLKNVHFVDNTADLSGGAIHTAGGDAQLSGCAFFNNLASQQYGNAIYNQTGSYSILNCTFADTKSSAGELYYQEAVRRLQIKNTIMWPSAYRVYPLSLPDQPVEISYSDFARDLLPSDGPTNFSEDLDGKARFDHPGFSNIGIGTIPYVDIGAFEYNP